MRSQLRAILLLRSPVSAVAGFSALCSVLYFGRRTECAACRYRPVLAVPALPPWPLCQLCLPGPCVSSASLAPVPALPPWPLCQLCAGCAALYQLCAACVSSVSALCRLCQLCVSPVPPVSALSALCRLVSALCQPCAACFRRHPAGERHAAGGAVHRRSPGGRARARAGHQRAHPADG